MNDQTPRVRPLGQREAGPPQDPGPSWSPFGLVALAVAGLIATLLLLDTRSQGPASPPTTDPLPESLVQPDAVTTTTGAPISTTTTTTIAAARPTPVPPGPPLQALLPEVEDVLVASVQGDDSQWMSWAAGAPLQSASMPLLGGADPPSFDVSGRHLAFLGPWLAANGPTLYLGTHEEWSPARLGVTSFAWHATRPARLAWIERPPATRLCTAAVDPGPTVGEPACMPVANDEVIGYDDAGFLMKGDGVILRLDPSGSPVASLAGIDARAGPAGDVLVADRSPDGALAYRLTGPLLQDPLELDWLANVPAVSGRPVVWSPPGADPVQVAFLVALGDSRYELHRRTLDGSMRAVLDLDGRVWDVAWDDTGRYLLVAGVIGERLHQIQVWDTTGPVVAVRMPAPVRSADLVTGEGCEHGGSIISGIEPLLPPGVALDEPRAVRSRDPRLGSWFFVSAAVVGGLSDGQIATWGFPLEGIDASTPLVPIEETAARFDFGIGGIVASDFGVEDWFELDGAAMSRWCVDRAAP